jgi:hypothetical protein
MANSREGRERTREQQHGGIAIGILLGGRCPQKARPTEVVRTKL